MVVVFPIQIFWMVVVFPIQIFWMVVVFPIQMFFTFRHHCSVLFLNQLLLVNFFSDSCEKFRKIKFGLVKATVPNFFFAVMTFLEKLNNKNSRKIHYGYFQKLQFFVCFIAPILNFCQENYYCKIEMGVQRVPAYTRIQGLEKNRITSKWSQGSSQTSSIKKSVGSCWCKMDGTNGMPSQGVNIGCQMDHLDPKQFVIYFGLHMHQFQKYCLSKLFTFFLQK